MKLIFEEPNYLDGYYEEELNESTGNQERNYYIEGIFSTPEKKNRNGRIYPRKIWEREVAKYQDEIENNTINTLGEWQHPPRSNVDPMEAVIKITELKIKEDGNVWGKAKVLNDNTEKTNKIKALIKEGMKIGISTRGVGRVSSTGVVTEFKLITADLVDMPSDYNAMLNGVVEGYTVENGILVDKEFEIDENGCVGEVCGLTNESKDEEKEKNKKCPIKEKIDIALEELKESIISEILETLEEKSKQEKEEEFKKNKEVEKEKNSDDDDSEETEKKKKKTLEESLLELSKKLKEYK